MIWLVLCSLAQAETATNTEVYQVPTETKNITEPHESSVSSFATLGFTPEDNSPESTTAIFVIICITLIATVTGIAGILMIRKRKLTKSRLQDVEDFIIPAPQDNEDDLEEPLNPSP